MPADLSFRPFVSGMIATVIGAILMRWLARRYPASQQRRPLSWYVKQYAWIDPFCIAAFLVGLAPGYLLYQTVLNHKDPRGIAVGYALACIFTYVTLVILIRLRPGLSLRGYSEYQELQTGISNGVWRCLAYLNWACFGVSLYGVAHLILNGP